MDATETYLRVDLNQRSSSREPRPVSHDSGVSDCSPTSSGHSKVFVALHDYTATKDDELSFKTGDIIKLIRARSDGWYEGEIDGRPGVFPVNRTQEVLQKDILMRFEVSEIEGTDSKGLEHSMLGQGAFAMVCKIRLHPKKMKSTVGTGRFSRLNTEQLFALKKFKDGFAQIPGQPYSEQVAIEKLKQEAMMVNCLSHPNIVELIGFCADKPCFGLILELCDGGSLRRLCDKLREKSVPLKTMVNWACQIATGMEYLIGQGYIHRDLKADNVLVKQTACLCDFEGENCLDCGRCGLGYLRLKIADFGGTRKITTQSVMSIGGTHAWLAPETFIRNSFTEKSDVWSFGVVLWEILTRDMPFRGVTPIAAAFQVAKGGQKLVIDKHCPTLWKTVMVSCWEVEREKRWKFVEIVKYFNAYAGNIKKKNIIIPPIAQKLEKIYDTVEPSKPTVRKEKPRISLLMKSPLSASLTSVKEATEGMFTKFKSSTRQIVSQLNDKVNGGSTELLSPTTAPQIRTRARSSGYLSSESQNGYLSPSSYCDLASPSFPSIPPRPSALPLDPDVPYDYITQAANQPPSFIAPKAPNIVNEDYCSKDEVFTENCVQNPFYECGPKVIVTTEVMDSKNDEDKDQLAQK